jgi:hypothetical protein
MEAYLPLIGLIALAVGSICVAYVLERAQHASRSVPMIRPSYRSGLQRRR